jgi:glycosyltransferase involved in cell wall biosynthesis
MDKISVVINTYNAEKYLQRVLDSVKGFDEVLICDMESTDATISIAQKNGCRVVTFPKGKHTIVEPARDFAIHEAKGPWVLVVDADELVTPELKDYLYDRILKPQEAIGNDIQKKFEAYKAERRAKGLSLTSNIDTMIKSDEDGDSRYVDKLWYKNRAKGYPDDYDGNR